AVGSRTRVDASHMETLPLARGERLKVSARLTEGSAAFLVPSANAASRVARAVCVRSSVLPVSIVSYATARDPGSGRQLRGRRRRTPRRHRQVVSSASGASRARRGWGGARGAGGGGGGR